MISIDHLLLVIGKGKAPRPHNVEGTRKKSIDFDGYILMGDLMMDAWDLLETLHPDGHFEFHNLAKNPGC